ncbi:MAG: hypothetical protein IPG59_18280 [Candidatus Melainabacteria bacterium]|nr:MAG: hypothetical protein IPG59_18280 [Candidatus Melainabacteria bacterium]
MILEAFAKYLRQADPQLHATEVLSCWLAERLLCNSTRENSVDSVIQCEITVDRVDNLELNDGPSNKTSTDNGTQGINQAPKTTMSHLLPVPQNNLSQIAQLDVEKSLDNSRPQNIYVFKGASQSGDRLLKSLVEYCLSIEHQKWARFVHSLKASDFKQID